MAKIFSFLDKSKSTIGIELGGNSIKMVETSKSAKGIQLLSWGIVEIPADKKGKSERDIPVISAFVKQLISQCRYPSSKVYFSISGPSVSFNRLNLPPMPDKEILPAIMWEGRKVFSFPLDNARVLYKKTGESLSDAKNIEVIVAAALNQFISNELEVFQQAGVSPSGIDTVFSAIHHAFQYSNMESRDSTTAFLDIEAEKTILSIFKGDVPLFSRELASSGNAFTRALMDPFSVNEKQYALSFEEAEKIKTTCGIPVGGDQGTTPQGIPLSRIMFMMRPVMERLTTETLRSFDFFKSQTREKSIDRVLLCSGGAGLKNLPELLSSGLGIEVSTFNPFESTVIPPEILKDDKFTHNKHRLSVAVGLAIGQSKDFNFLPVLPGKLATVNLRNWIPLFVFILFSAFLFTTYSRLNTSVEAGRKELESCKAGLSSLNVSIGKLTELTEKRDALKAKLTDYPEFSLEQPQLSEVFVFLTNVFPDNISLSRLVMEKKKTASDKSGAVSLPDILIRLEGIANGKDYEVFSLIAKITESLKKGTYFYDVQLVSSEINPASEQPGVRFVLECLLEPGCFI